MLDHHYLRVLFLDYQFYYNLFLFVLAFSLATSYNAYYTNLCRDINIETSPNPVHQLNTPSKFLLWLYSLYQSGMSMYICRLLEKVGIRTSPGCSHASNDYFKKLSLQRVTNSKSLLIVSFW